VGVGTQVAVRPVLGMLALGKQEGAGPRRAGEVVTFRFTAEDASDVLRARLVDRKGEPVAQTQVRVAVDAGEQVLRTIGATDECGRFEHHLDPKWKGQPLLMAQFEALRLGNATGQMARAELEHAVVAGVIDLGDLMLDEGPFIASGVVVDQAGRSMRATGMIAVPAADAANPRRRGLPVSVRATARGAFTIRGFVDVDDLVLTTEERARPAPFAPIAFRRGATDLRVVWHRQGKIVARVTHDLPFALTRLLRLEAVDASGERKGGWSAGPDSASRQRISLSSVPSGRYIVQVRLPDDPVPLAVVEDVEVGVGEATDPRLSSIDVRGRVRVAHLRVVDELGQPIRGEGRLHLPFKDPGSIAHVDLEAGAFLVPVGSRPAQGTIRVPGFRDHEVSDIDGDRTVELERAITLRARLTPDLPLPPGTTLHAFVRPAGQKPGPLEWLARAQNGHFAISGTAGTALLRRGEFAFALARPGDYEVTFVLADQAQTSSAALATVPAAAAVTTASSQEVTFTADAVDVQRALRELER
jgi:hypothetical protein